MNKITHLQAASLYESIYGETDKIDLAALKDIFAAAWSTKDGEHLYYRTVFLRAAKLCRGIADKKPFPARNRAMAVLCALTLLELNGLSLAPTEQTTREILSFPSSEEGVFALGEWLEANVTNANR